MFLLIKTLFKKGACLKTLESLFKLSKVKRAWIISYNRSQAIKLK